MMKTKMKSAVLALALGTFTAGAWAAEVGSPSTATTTFAVNNPGVVSHTLTAGAPLVAGLIKKDTVLASGNVSVSDQANTFAIRFTPGSCEPVPDRPARCSYKGVNNEGHLLNIWMHSQSSGTDHQTSDNAWMIAGNGSSGDGTYLVKVDAEDQTLESDHYNISVDAVEWQN